MDELELLKKDWNKEVNTYPKLSYKDIYKMILKKSSSIVKWIFIISVLEFIFWLLLSVGLKLSDKRFEFGGVEDTFGFIVLTILSYAIIGYFFYRFYTNYKTINATDNVKKLMENIMKTRRTVKQYVGFNILLLIASVVYMTPYALNNDPKYASIMANAEASGEVFKYYAGIIIAIFIITVVAVGIVLLLYWLIYGILLKRLNNNYKELKKLEV